MMDKEGFKKVLASAGLTCQMKDGIPTVFTDDKKVISQVRKLAKDNGYNSSFGIKFDKSVIIETADDEEEDLTEVVMEQKKELGIEVPTIDPDKVEIVSETPEKEEPTESPEEAAEETSFISQPSIFDMFDGFD